MSSTLDEPGRFSPIVDDGPLRLVVVGAGPMGRRWIDAISRNRDVELVGVADLVPDVARRALTELDVEARVGSDATELAMESGAHAIVDAAVPAAHHAVTWKALRAHIPVLGEKPAAATTAQALSLAATSRDSGTLFVVSQSRRFNRNVLALREAVRAVGEVGIMSAQFFRAPHFGGFRESMSHPLLLDMAIHPFDTARYLIEAEPVSVVCEEFNPSWSWYAGDAAVVATFTMSNGARFAYTASWCSPGLETSWNGEWRLSGRHGSALWDGEEAPQVQNEAGPNQTVDVPEVPGESIHGSLVEFIDTLRSGEVSRGEIGENIQSLLMVEAAVRASETGERIVIADLLDDALAEALRDETDASTQRVLEIWSRDGLSAHGGG